MPETKRMIVKITVPEHSGWSMEEVSEEVEAAILEVADYFNVLVEIQ
jgi:hypothetical protein